MTAFVRWSLFSCNYLTTRGSTKPAQAESIFIQMQLIFHLGRVTPDPV